MKKFGVPRWAWALFLLLLVATSMILFGSRESRSNPDSGSYAASGLKAFRTLLQVKGMQTRQSFSTVRPIQRNELAVCVFRASELPNIDQDDWNKEVPIGSLLRAHLENGGRVLMVSIPADFRESSRIALKQSTRIISATNGNTRSISVGQSGSYGDWNTFAYSAKGNVLWKKSDEEPFIWIDKKHGGYLTGVANGLGFTNRFLDREDNAQVMYEALRLAAGPLNRVVFLEGAHGAVSNPSLVEIIGPWATGAWWQLTVAFVALVVSLGLRFGLPEREKFVQRGARELGDAMSDLFFRSKATDVAMQALVQDADRQIRKRLKIAGDTPKETRNQMLPESLLDALQNAENAEKDRAPVSAALPIARRLDYELAAFVGHRDRRPAKRRRR